MIYPWVLFASVVGTFLLVGPAHRRFGTRTTAIAGGLIGMVFWVTPFVLRHLHLWPVEGSVASTAGLLVFSFRPPLFGATGTPPSRRRARSTLCPPQPLLPLQPHHPTPTP